MKYFTLLVFAIFFVTNSRSGQIPDQKSVTWMGLDFTDAKLYTSAGFSNPEAIRDNLLESLNDIILRESSKYNIAKFFDIDTLSYDLSVLKDRNILIPVDKLVVNKSPNKFDEQNVKSNISRYPKVEGIGQVFIIESFDKTNKIGTFGATFFDRSTSEVMSNQGIQRKASGNGIRNYWANSIYSTLKSFGSKKVK